MNPMVRSYLEQIQGTLADLEEAASDQKRLLDKEREKRDKLLQRYWSRQKEITVLGQGREDYEALSEENRKLREVHSIFREHLGRLLECTKALGTELRQ
jgi:hypothetical protein